MKTLDVLALITLALAFMGASMIEGAYSQFSATKKFYKQGILATAKVTSGSTREYTTGRRIKKTQSSFHYNLQFKTQKGQPIATEIAAPAPHYAQTYPFEIQVTYDPENPHLVRIPQTGTATLDTERVNQGWMFVAVGSLGLLYGAPRVFLLLKNQDKSNQQAHAAHLAGDYYLVTNGATTGPYSADHLLQLSRDLPADSLVWKTGMPTWISIHQFLQGIPRQA